MILASVALVLISMYGGDTTGLWFEIKMEVTESGYVIGKLGSEFTLDEVEFVTETRGSDDTFQKEREDDRHDDEIEELMVEQIKKLLYVVILAGFAALYFLNNGDQEKGAMACLAMGGAGLLAVTLFALNFPEALEDDTEVFEMVDEDPSLFGNGEVSEIDGATQKTSALKSEWRPGIAPALILISGIIGIAAYYEIKNKPVGPKEKSAPVVTPDYELVESSTPIEPAVDDSQTKETEK